MTNLEITNAYVGDTQVEKIYLGTDVVWGGSEPEPIYSAMPLTFEILSDGVITFKCDPADAVSTTSPIKTIYYSINDGPRISITSSVAGAQFSVQNGDVVQFFGNNSTYADRKDRLGNHLNCTGEFNLYGNVASLVNSTNFTGITSFHERAFTYLLSNNSGLSKIKEIAFGANYTTSGTGDYFAYSLLSRCPNLNYIKCLFKNPTTTYFSAWMSSNTYPQSPGLFIKHPDANWASNASGIPPGWTVEDADV
jgi:hypothetical protein